MDPDATLDEIRSWVDGDNSGQPPELRADKLAELVDSLDYWLTRGGFLPAAWGQELRNDQRELAIRQQERRERGEQ